MLLYWLVGLQLCKAREQEWASSEILVSSPKCKSHGQCQRGPATLRRRYVLASRGCVISTFTSGRCEPPKLSVTCGLNVQQCLPWLRRMHAHGMRVNFRKETKYSHLCQEVVCTSIINFHECGPVTCNLCQDNLLYFTWALKGTMSACLCSVKWEQRG